MIVGHSMGATVALLAAATDNSRLGAVIGAGVAFGPRDSRERAGLLDLADAVEATGWSRLRV